MASKMKDSGVEWIGEIPEGWSLGRFKDAVMINNGKETQSDDGNVPVYGSGGAFKWTDAVLCHGPALLMGRKGTIDKPLYVDEPFWTVDTMFYATPKESFELKYCYYLATCFNYDYYQSGSTLPSMTQTDLGSILVPFPKKEEQKKIVSYTSEACSRIDAAISTIEKELDVLERYKASLIHEAVTKGLNSDAPMKDSGVEWIGKIPERWEVSRIKHLLDYSHPYPIGDGDHGLIKADDYLTEGIPYIRVLNLTWGKGLDLAGLVYISPNMNRKIQSSILRPGDILIAKTGATIGKTAIVPSSLPIANTTSHVGKITLPPWLNPYYFYFAVSSQMVQQQIADLSSMQSTRPELGIDGLKNLYTTVPPKKEQDEIAEYLEIKCQLVNSLLSNKASQLDLLKRQRQSLIYEYVTGKKRVPGYGEEA